MFSDSFTHSVEFQKNWNGERAMIRVDMQVPVRGIRGWLADVFRQLASRLDKQGSFSLSVHTDMDIPAPELEHALYLAMEKYCENLTEVAAQDWLERDFQEEFDNHMAAGLSP